MEALETKDPLDILAYQYDIVCNGVELSSGAIRNHRPEIMYKAFEIAGYSQADVDANFAGMINALKFGAPPHGGLGPRRRPYRHAARRRAEHPRGHRLPDDAEEGEDLMMGAPSFVSAKQLRELNLRSTAEVKAERRRMPIRPSPPPRGDGRPTAATLFRHPPEQGSPPPVILRRKSSTGSASQRRAGRTRRHFLPARSLAQRVEQRVEIQSGAQ